MRYRLSKAAPAVAALAAAGIGLVAAACGGDGGGPVYVGEPSGRIAFMSERDGNREIYVMDASGANQTNRTNSAYLDDEPWWSPDGTGVVFASFRGPSDLYTMNADGSDLRKLTDDPAVDGGPRWSPDGSRIAFYSFRQESAGLLWVIETDGTDPHPLLFEQVADPETPCAGGFPGDWFPDGSRILFRGSQGSIRATQICSVAADGSDIQIVLSEEGVTSEFPTISPDGQRIALTSDRGGNREIYTMNIDGSGLRAVTDHSALDQYPVWSPDGQWIAFHSDRDGDLEIYIVRPDGSDLRQLTNNTVPDMNPSWSP